MQKKVPNIAQQLWNVEGKLLVIRFLHTEVLKDNQDLKKAANKHNDGLAEMDLKQNKMRVKHCTLQNIQ